MSNFTMYYKLDGDSLFPVIQNMTAEDILPFMMINKRYQQIVLKLAVVPSFKSLTQKTLRMFPAAKTISFGLENYVDTFGDDERYKNADYEFHITFSPNDVSYIPYLDRIANKLISLNVPFPVPNTVELLPILLKMSNLQTLVIDAGNLCKISQLSSSALVDIYSLPQLKLVKITALSLTLISHYLLWNDVFGTKMDSATKTIIYINRLQDNDDLLNVVNKAPKNVHFMIDCNENYDGLYDLLAHKSVYLSFNRVYTGIGCTVSKDTDNAEKYRKILDGLFVQYMPRAICPNCFMDLQFIQDALTVTTLYSVNEELLEKMKRLEQLTVSEQFGELKTSYDFRNLLSLTSLKLIGFESKKRSVKLPSRLKELEVLGFINEEKDVDVENVEGFVGLTVLTKLAMTKCQSISLSLPSSLKSLQLTDFPCMSELPLQRLQILSSISVNSCAAMTSILLGDAVRTINLVNCGRLKNVHSFKKDFKLTADACYALEK
ncbi:hypothetical protein EIN_054050 [Entamoeba invadens IP1]|uniref:hypothetical protein n=1 Tax=Entamoeba invadens IP1 TaxID=370355 RepID=UPI0002C3DABF|nr:hypothetical protein EIN_054050 [Entamoeba invadens IP1]ELP93140.1 hypothetical protein EIN_054050 [Entamoeba invadens IP1]|eukprot:XP_004259911.1 hypothetical protein EIN_054050 [Entamoeba invadens IP1]